MYSFIWHGLSSISVGVSETSLNSHRKAGNISWHSLGFRASPVSEIFLATLNTTLYYHDLKVEEKYNYKFKEQSQTLV